MLWHNAILMCYRTSRFTSPCCVRKALKQSETIAVLATDLVTYKDYNFRVPRRKKKYSVISWLL